MVHLFNKNQLGVSVSGHCDSKIAYEEEIKTPHKWLSGRTGH